MKEENIQILSDKLFKTMDALINYIDCKDKNKLKYNKLRFIGNEIDAYKLINKYHLKEKEKLSCDNYGLFKDSIKPTHKNSYIIGPIGKYANRIIKLDIQGNLVEICFSPNAKIENSFKSKNLKNFTNENFVVLDVETTGLNFIQDDIIEFCIYENEEKYFRKYLPLENRKTNTAFGINKIEDEKLLKANPLTQEEVDYIIEKFDLINKVILIWSGANLFDRTFLEIYFLKHNLKGIENFTFYNVEMYAKEKLLGLQSYSKDYIALLYGISTLNSHNALEDCIIEKKIISKLLNNTQILLDAREHYIKVKEFLMKANYNSLDAEKIYNEFCAFLYRKNGPVSNDYDKNPITRGKEWMDIHHIDENIIDDIASRTNHAKEDNDRKALKELEPYNKKERLIFATKIEHFILHCLLDIIRECFSGGPHFLFGDLLKIETGIFENNTKEYNIQKGKSVFYKDITFFEIIEIYCKNLILNNANLENCAKDFYKLENYSFDNEKHDNIIKRIKIEKRMLEGNDKSN
jgi:DNA polymerase III epsilon subunit-like protein